MVSKQSTFNKFQKVFWRGRNSSNLTFPPTLIKDRHPFIYLRVSSKISLREAYSMPRTYCQSFYITQELHCRRNQLVGGYKKLNKEMLTYLKFSKENHSPKRPKRKIKMLNKKDQKLHLQKTWHSKISSLKSIISES